jgi:hypothetical protein
MRLGEGMEQAFVTLALGKDTRLASLLDSRGAHG